jgi:hypothetical protein
MIFVVPAGARPLMTIVGLATKRGETLSGSVIYFSDVSGSGCVAVTGA